MFRNIWVDKVFLSSGVSVINYNVALLWNYRKTKSLLPQQNDHIPTTGTFLC